MQAMLKNIPLKLKSVDLNNKCKRFNFYLMVIMVVVSLAVK